jgi:hypothetical protein
MLTSHAKLPFRTGWCYHPGQKDPLLSQVVTPPGTKRRKFSCRGISREIPLLSRVMDPWQKVGVLYKPRRLPDRHLAFFPQIAASPLFLCRRRCHLSSLHSSATRPSPTRGSSPTHRPSPTRRSSRHDAPHRHARIAVSRRRWARPPRRACAPMAGQTARWDLAVLTPARGMLTSASTYLI